MKKIPVYLLALTVVLAMTLAFPMTALAMPEYSTDGTCVGEGCHDVDPLGGSGQATPAPADTAAPTATAEPTPTPTATPTPTPEPTLTPAPTATPAATEAPEQTTPSNSSVWLYVLLVVVAAAIAVGIIVSVRKKKTK